MTNQAKPVLDPLILDQVQQLAYTAGHLLGSTKGQHNHGAEAARKLALFLAEKATSLLIGPDLVKSEPAEVDGRPTLSEYLGTNIAAGKIDHVIRSHVCGDGLVEFYIRPQFGDGDTVQFVANGNSLSRPDHQEKQAA